jgi:antitoxin component YwqK of YwqJK toxin-antitoxin module
MKKFLIVLLPISLFLSFGYSQQLIRNVIENYNNGNIKTILYHKKIGGVTQKVKEENYYENGQMKSEGTYKDGKLNGLVTSWYENGKKKYDVTFKDGGRISMKKWNEDGSVKE